MPTAVLLGITVPIAQRLKSALAGDLLPMQEGWAIQYVRSEKRHFWISNQNAAAAMEVASKSDRPHIFAVLEPETPSRNHGLVAAERAQQVGDLIKPYFRICWLKPSLLAAIGGNRRFDFFNYFTELLDVEAEWDTMVRPASLRSPLLLPRSCFETSAPDATLWEMAERFGDSGNVQVARNAITRFEQGYLKPTEGGARKWTDRRENVYCHQGARHRIAPFPKSWKYSFPIDDGFHYDVTSVSGRAFRLIGRDGKQASALPGGHLNVDPHGYIL